MNVKEAMEKVFAAAKRDQGINTSDGIRDLANALFLTCRCADEMTDEEWTNTMAFLGGMACGALTEYADRLEEEGQ